MASQILVMLEYGQLREHAGDAAVTHRTSSLSQYCRPVEVAVVLDGVDILDHPFSAIEARGHAVKMQLVRFPILLVRKSHVSLVNEFPWICRRHDASGVSEGRTS